MVGAASGRVADWLWSHRVYWRIPIVAAGFGVGVPALLYGMCVTALGLVFFLFPILFGFLVASSYFYETVIEPATCSPTISATARRSWMGQTRSRPDGSPQVERPNLANCVEVRTKELGRFRGRKVIATADLIVLFDPASGEVLRVPLKDATVVWIGKL